MNVQPYQLIFLVVYSILMIGVWKIKNNKIRIFIAFLGFILFFVSPVKFKQEGGAKIERSVTRFNDLPQKVVVETEEFQQRQDAEMNQLKQQTEDLKDEIHN